MNAIQRTALAAFTTAAIAVSATPALAQTSQPTGATATAAGEMTSGEVKKIDKQAGRVTLQHGDIKNLGMPGMTMTFAVKDKAALDKLKVGDKVKFAAVDDNGKLTVIAIQPAK